MNQIAINPQTGELAEFDGSAWKPVDKSRVAQDASGNIAVFDGAQWKQIGARPGPTNAAAAAQEQGQAQYLRSQNVPGAFQAPQRIDPNATRDTLRENPSDFGTRVTGALGKYADAAMLGSADEALAGIYGLGAMAPGGSSPGQAFNQELARLEQARRDYEALNTPEGSIATGAGIVMNPLNLLGGEFVSAAKSGIGTVGRSAALGGGYGATAGALSTEGDLENRAIGAGYGAGFGATAGAPLALFGATAAPKVSPQVQQLMKKGVTPTPGQVMGGAAAKLEEKLASVPIAGDMITAGRLRAMEDFNRAAINDVLAPLGKTGNGAVGRTGIAETEKIIGNEYDRILKNVTFVEDQQLTQEVQQLRNLAGSLPDTEQKQFEKIITDIGKKIQNGQMSGEEFKIVESQLSFLARRYGKDPSAYVNQLGDLVGDLQTALRDSLPRTNPMFAQPLQNANAAWAKFKRLQRAATYVGGKDAEPGVFTPDQFQSAVKAMDSSKDKGAFARGSANMQGLSDAGKAVLGSKVPDSGTPSRLMAAILAGGFIEPSTLALGAGLSLPYTKIGQGLLAKALTSRPQWLRATAPMLNMLPGPLGTAAGLLGGSMAPAPMIVPPKGR